ncbi:TPA: hypothetical protein ACWLZK_000071 [Klebsiella quasipneumoniae]
MILPKHRYYSLEKVAKITKCEVSDLIHFASIGLLQLCIKIPQIELLFDSSTKKDGEKINLINVESDSILPVDFFKEKYDIKPDDDADIQRLRFSYKSDYFSFTEQYDMKSGNKSIEKWSGFLAIPQEFIEADERYLSDFWGDWDITIDTLELPRCENATFRDGYVVGGFYFDDWYTVHSEHMYITSYEFELLCNGGKEITSEANLATRNNSNTLLSSPLTINKKAERHASNRERLLKAAIYILSKYPDDCRGERKEISPEKWRDALMTHVSEVPPLMITNEEVILRQLRAAVNGKGDS